MNVLFSIVVPTYNGKKTIGKLLEKISSFEKADVTETIIIDSSSSDGTVKIVQNYSRLIKNLKVIKIDESEFDHGLTRNLGVKIAKGKYVCFFSQDVLPRSSKILSCYLEDFNRDKNVVAVYGKHYSFRDTPIIQKIESDCFWDQLDQYLNKQGILVKNLKKPFIPYNEKNKILWYQLSNASSCYKKSFLLKYLFPKTNYGEDMLLAKKILEEGRHIVYDTRCAIDHSHIYSHSEYLIRERESLSLVIKNLKLPKQSHLLCKLKKLLRLQTSVINKTSYILNLAFYYIIKALMILYIKIQKN